MKNNDAGPDFSSLLSIPEYAKLKGFTTQAIYAQINSGRLDHAIRKVGSRRYIDMNLVDQKEWPLRRSRGMEQSLDRLLFSEDEDGSGPGADDESRPRIHDDDKHQTDSLDLSKTKGGGFSSLHYEQRVREEKLLFLSARREEMELQLKKARGELIVRSEVEGLAQEYYAECRQLLELMPQKIVSRMGLDESASLLLETVTREAARLFLKRMEEALEKKKSRIAGIAGL